MTHDTFAMNSVIKSITYFFQRMEDPFSTSQLESSHTYVKRKKRRSHLRESVGVGRMEEVRLESVLGITVNSSEGVAVCPLTGGHWYCNAGSDFLS